MKTVDLAIVSVSADPIELLSHNVFIETLYVFLGYDLDSDGGSSE